MSDNSRSPHRPASTSRSRLRLENPAIRVPLAISLGAISGALSRYYLTLFCSQVFGLSWIGTFAINLSGAFGMGFFMKLVSEQVIISADLRFLIAVGCLGSYTTFSTYELETVMLLDNHWQLGLLYWLGTAILGVLCLELGHYLAGGWLDRKR